MSVMGGPGLTSAQVGAFIQAPIASQEWFGTPCAGTATFPAVVNTLYATPWIAPETCLIDQISSRATPGAAGLLKMGIYASDANNDVGVLLGEGTADLDTTSPANHVSTLAAPAQVVAGKLYWPVGVYSGTPTVQGFSNSVPGGGGYFWPIGSLRNTGNPWLLGGFFFVSRALTYVSGPTPFFPASFGAMTITTPNAPIFALRKA